MFERLNGWQLGHIIGWRSLIFALVIEIVATFGVALVWLPTRARKRPDIRVAFQEVLKDSNLLRTPV
jgi:predicted MFS family arabinose efflux permease